MGKPFVDLCKEWQREDGYNAWKFRFMRESLAASWRFDVDWIQSKEQALQIFDDVWCGMPEDYQMIVQSHYKICLSMVQIGKNMGITMQAVGSRKENAQRRMALAILATENMAPGDQFIEAIKMNTHAILSLHRANIHTISQLSDALEVGAIGGCRSIGVTTEANIVKAFDEYKASKAVAV